MLLTVLLPWCGSRHKFVILFKELAELWGGGWVGEYMLVYLCFFGKVIPTWSLYVLVLHGQSRSGVYSNEKHYLTHCDRRQSYRKFCKLSCTEWWCLWCGYPMYGKLLLFKLPWIFLQQASTTFCDLSKEADLYSSSCLHCVQFGGFNTVSITKNFTFCFQWMIIWWFDCWLKNSILISFCFCSNIVLLILFRLWYIGITSVKSISVVKLYSLLSFDGTK